MPDGHTRPDGEAAGIVGRPFDRADRRAAIKAVLVSRPGVSNRAIAANLGVDHKTVAAVREVAEATGEIPQFETRKGKDGKERRKPPPKPRTASAATATDLAALAAAIKRDREIDNARFAALERSDAENRKLLGREPPAPTLGSEWVFVKEAAGLAGRSESAVWNWIKRGQIKPLTSSTGRTIVRISDLPAKRTAGEKCE